MKSLDDIINYQNDDVLYRFTKNYDVSFNEANDIFIETKKWLWLGFQKEEILSFGIDSVLIDNSLSIIDTMWHNFILFTKDYTDFCHHYFGSYIHHVPTVKPKQSSSGTEKSIEQIEQQIVNTLRPQYQLVFALLGENTFVKWYRTYPEKYSPPKLKKLRRS
ncbi:MAG: hypothetical protein ABJI60_12475 [Kangiellaceae bacterium]